MAVRMTTTMALVSPDSAGPTSCGAAVCPGQRHRLQVVAVVQGRVDGRVVTQLWAALSAPEEVEVEAGTLRRKLRPSQSLQAKTLAIPVVAEQADAVPGTRTPSCPVVAIARSRPVPRRQGNFQTNLITNEFLRL